MTFGEKLFKLRKANGLSQETLAEQLDTSRQAVSKWENNQGYPETDKIIMISSIFNVSTDYLLKDTEVTAEEVDGFYVSKEMATSYLVDTNKKAKYISFGLFFIALAFMPYFIFVGDPKVYIIPTVILATIGIGLCISTSNIDEKYKQLKKEVLIFDNNYLNELSMIYESLKNRYKFFIIIGSCLLVSGLLTLGIERKFIQTGFLLPYYPICIGLIAIGIYIISYTSTILDAYKLLVENKTYTSRFSFILRKKVRRKIDDL